MRSTVAAIATLGMLSIPAFAADLPSRRDVIAPPVYAPIFTWTGFYIGLNAGVGWQDSSSVYVTTPSGAVTSLSTGSNSAGFVGGGQIGYNYQTGAWVFGLEADIQYADIGGKVNWGQYSWWGAGGSDQYFGTVRARVGYAIDRTLLYLTGGFAYGGMNSNLTGGSSDSTGWTVGGGVEYAFTNNWTVKLEGLYVNLENKSQTLAFANPAGGILPAGTYTAVGQSSKGGGVVRVGVNYKF